MMGGAKKRVPKRRFKEFLNAGEWKERKLSELATMNARIGWQNLRTSEFLDSGDYLLITGTDFDNGRVKYSTCHYVEKKRFDQDTKIQLSTGSILITKDGTLGKVALVEELPKPATLNAGVFNVRVKDDTVLSYKYLYHYLKAPFLMKYVTANATGGTIKHLNQSILVDFPIPITEKPEQDRITKLLDSLESSITLHQRKLDKLQATKKALLQEMFPEEGQNKPKRRFKGFTDAWEQRKFNDFVTIRRGLTYKPSDIAENGIRVLRSSNIDEDQFIKSNDDVFVNIDAVNIPFAKNGDILITSANGSNRLVGKHTIISDIAENSTVHGGFMLLAETNNPLFTDALLSSNWYKRFINTYVAGGNGAIGNLSKSDLESQSVMVPSEHEQTKIGQWYDNINQLITLHQRKLDKLKNLKQAYLNEMFV